MPKRLIALVTLLSGLAVIQVIVGIQIAAEIPALGVASIGTAAILAFSAFGICLKRKEVSTMLPISLAIIPTAIACLLLVTPSRASGAADQIVRILRGTLPFLILLFASTLILKSRRARDYFCAPR